MSQTSFSFTEATTPPRRDIVEAGAGCGKTHGLVSRYLEGLGVDPATGKSKASSKFPARPREILCLTFTEDAAREMQERIQTRLAELGRDDLLSEFLEESRVGTFHSLCLKLLRPFLAELGYDERGRLVAPPVASRLRRRHLLSRLRRFPDAAALIGTLAASKVLDLGERLWFSILAEDLERENASLERARGAFETSLADLRADFARARDALKPEEVETSFLPAVEEFLAGRSDGAALRKITFTSGAARKLKKLEPVFYEGVQRLREMADDGLLDALSDRGRAEEIEALERLFAFLRFARDGAPRILDFNALEEELAALLERREREGERLLPPPRLILVDEFQDTNERQFGIVQRLAGPETELYVVGDPKQSIYAFRKADVRVFLRLRASPDLSLRTLDTNYRSDRAPLDFFNRVVAGLFRPSERPEDPPPQSLLFAEGRTGRVDLAQPIRVFEAPPRHDFSSALRDAYLRRREELGPGHTHVALFTSWKRLHQTATELARLGLRVRLPGPAAPLKHLLTRLFVSYLRALAEPEAKLARFALEFWRHADPARRETSGPLPSPLSSDVIGAARAFCLAVSPRRFEGGAEWATALYAFLEAFEASGEVALLDYASVADALEASSTAFEASLEALGPASEDPEALGLMTVHASKGLQFSALYLPEFVEAERAGYGLALENEEGSAFEFRFASTESGKPRPSLLHRIHARFESRQLAAEKRRLFYVALTRAKHSLDLFLHTPGDPKSSPDPWLALGLPPKDQGHWNRLLKELRFEFADLEAKGVLAWTLFDESKSEDAPALDRSRLWTWPAPAPNLAPAPAFYREGVSRYLRRLFPEDPARARFRRPRGLEAAFVKRRDQTQLGTRLHEILELWNGDADHLARLARADDDPRLRILCEKIRALPELEAYFEDLRQHPERIRKEFGLFVTGENYRLSGFADALWCRDPDRWILLDWKTSRTQAALADDRRRELIRAQLELYARSLAGEGRRLESWAIAIGFEPEPSAHVHIL